MGFSPWDIKEILWDLSVLFFSAPQVFSQLCQFSSDFDVSYHFGIRRQSDKVTDKVVKKLGAGAKNNTDCWSFSYGIRSFPTVIPSHVINPTEFFCRVTHLTCFTGLTCLTSLSSPPYLTCLNGKPVNDTTILDVTDAMVKQVLNLSNLSHLSYTSYLSNLSTLSHLFECQTIQLYNHPGCY